MPKNDSIYASNQDCINYLLRYFRAAQNNQHLKEGFDKYPYGMSKIGISLMSAIQQKTFDEQGAEDIIVNSVSIKIKK